MVKLRSTLACALATSLVATPCLADGRPYEGPTVVEAMDAPMPTVASAAAVPAEESPGAEAPVVEAAELDQEPESEPPDDYDPLVDSPEAMDAKHFVRGGVVLMVTAVALGIGSVIMGTSDPCSPRGGNSCIQAARDRAALAMGIPAAVMMAGGATLLGVGLARRARLRASLGLSRRGAVVSATFRF